MAILDGATGAERRRIALSGPALAMVADPRSGALYVASGPESDRTAPITAVPAGGPPRRMTSLAAVGLPVVVTTDGTVVFARATRPMAATPAAVDLATLTPAGRVRWRATLPAPSFGGSRLLGTATALPNGGLAVTIGDLLYRFQGRRLAPPAPAAPRLIVRPSRFRFAGPEQVCPSGAASCRPSAPRGAVAELRLPARTPPSAVRITLRNVRAAQPTRLVDLRLRTAAGSQWVAIRGLSPCPDCGLPPRLVPGRYLVRAAWTERGRPRAVAAEVTILTNGAR